MSQASRDQFWKVLLETHDNTKESIERLSEAMPPVHQICRFRSVNESSLMQLQSNRLLFSSADYYDDPFDTYFHIQGKTIEALLTLMGEAYAEGAVDGVRNLLLENKLLPEGETLDFLMGNITQEPPSPVALDQQMHVVRAEMQKRSYSICFCDNPLNESLWLKYADSHRGYVLVYESDDQNSLLCGTNKSCASCMLSYGRPVPYPVYYSDEKYDAIRYALGVLAMSMIPADVQAKHAPLFHAIADEMLWELERISLNKKKCHEHDQEWRMIYPTFPTERPGIGMRPTYVALGLRMPEYERRLVLSAAKVAGIASIREMYIDENEDLAMRPIGSES